MLSLQLFLLRNVRIQVAALPLLSTTDLRTCATACLCACMRPSRVTARSLISSGVPDSFEFVIAAKYPSTVAATLKRRLGTL